MTGKSNENKQSRSIESAEELFNISNVVADTLSKLNEVNREQCEGIVRLSSNISRDMIDLVEAANLILKDDKSKNKDIEPIKERLNEISEKAKDSMDAMTTTLHSNADDKDKSGCGDSMSDFRTAAEQALANAFNNAVASQQQANVLMQAAVTQGITTLYSVVTAALGEVEAKRLKDN